MKVDLLTLNFLLLIQLGIQAVGWVALHNGLHTRPGIRNIMLGSVAAALGTTLHPMRAFLPPVLVISCANLLIMAGYALVMVGLAQFTGRPPLRWLAWLMVLFTAAVWPAMLLLAPDDVSLRIMVFSFIVGVLATATGLNMIGAKGAPPLLRWFLVGLNLAQGLSSLLRAAEAAIAPPRDYYLAEDAAQIMWFLGTILYVGLHFIALVALVGSRLLAELTERNRALAEEVEARRRLQEQLSTALDQESAMRRDQRLFIDMVGHDFRTPVAVIDRAAEMLETLLPGAPSAIAQRLAAIRAAGRRLRRLLETFLATEQLEAGLKAGRREPVLLLPLLQDLQAELPAGEAARLRFELPDAADQPIAAQAIAAQPIAALGDAEWLGAVCANLIDNALKYSAPDGVVLLRLEREADTALLCVADHGIGIPPAELAQIGNRFFRASNAGMAKGTGFGLYAARRLIEAQGGNFKLFSEAGAGTRVELRLPLAHSDQMQQIPTNTGDASK